MATQPSRTFVRRTLTVVGISVLTLVVGLVSWMASTVLLTLFAGVLVGVLLRGSSQWLSARTRLSYLYALTVVCVAVLLAAFGFSAFLAASVSQQLSELVDQLPPALEQVRSTLAANPLGARILGSMEGGAEGGGAGQGAASQVFNAATIAVTALGNTVLILFVGLFLAADPDIYRRGLVRLFPPASRDRTNDVLDEIGDVLLRWLLGRIVLMAVIGLVTWVGLMLMGVPLALALGVIAGALSFIPNIGPIISAIPAMLLAATEQPIMAVYVAALYLALQTAESYLLEPYVVRKTADLPAAMVIGFQLLMGTLAGVMGLMMATPLLAMLTVAVDRVYVEDVLGDAEPASGPS